MANCQNCGNKIEVTIFKGEPFCSDDCRKALGLDRKANGTLILLSEEEQELIREIRDPRLR